MLDIIKILYHDENNHSKTWEAPTTKYTRFMSKLKFEVMYKLDLF